MSGGRSVFSSSGFSGASVTIQYLRPLAFAKEQKNGAGKYVLIKHKNGYSTLYAHLSEINIKPVQRVRQGTIIGKVGKTGNANYSKMKTHLHFEVRHGDKAINPRKFLQ